MTMIPKDDSGQQVILTAHEQLIFELRRRRESGKYLRWEDFSFDASQQRAKHITGELSDLTLEERRES